jgi:hypothetical protein
VEPGGETTQPAEAVSTRQEEIEQETAAQKPQCRSRCQDGNRIYQEVIRLLRKEIGDYYYETLYRIMGFRHDVHVIVCPVWY